LYHSFSELNRHKAQHRWIARILPSGRYSAGRIPPLKDRESHNPKLLEWERHQLSSFQYDLKTGEREEEVSTYFKDKQTGHVIGSIPPPDPKKNRLHLGNNLSSVADPLVGLTDCSLDGIENSLSGGGDDYPSSVGLSPVPSSRIGTRQGLKGITSYGRKTIREGCFLLTKKYGRAGLGFYTLTLPHRGRELEAICLNWAKILNRFFEELSRAYSRRGVSLEYVCAVEIQEKRYRKYGEVAPHIHYVANSCVDGRYVLSPRDIRAIFRMVCSRFVPSSVSFDSAENVQTIRRDAGNYLSKYLSKGGEMLAEIAASASELLPRRWFKTSPNIRTEILKATLVFYDLEAWNFLYVVKDAVSRGIDGYSLGEVYVSVSDDCDMLVGMYGKCPVSILV
jgi:hypothetical protein